MPHFFKSLQDRLLPSSALVVAIAFAVIPAYLLTAKGPFFWHMTQQSFYQGAGEIVALAVIAFIAARVRHRALWAALIITSAVYARRHGVDAPIIITYLYVEGIYALGAVAARLLQTGLAPQTTPASTVTCFGAGLTLWLLILWSHSFFKLTGILGIPTLALVVLGTAILLNRHSPLYGALANQLGAISRKSPVSYSIYIAAFLGLFAKSALTIDYDSMWYGLQLDRSLAPSGSLYDAVGLVAPVHYYPKLYEALLLPLMPTQSTSVLYGLGIYSLFISALLIPHIWLLLQKERDTAPPGWLILLPLCIPAFMNIALTAKGDSFSAACFIAAVYCTAKAWADRSSTWALLGMSFAGYAALARLAAIPYAVVICGYLGLMAVLFVRKEDRSAGTYLRLGTFVAALLVAALVLYRGVLLAGVPLISPPQLLELESKAGFFLSYPIGSVPASNTETIPLFEGLTAYIFNPTHYGLLQTTWSGNSWVLFLLICPALGLLRPKWVPLSSLLLTGLCGLVVLFTFTFRPGMGADGNYFIIPFLCLSLAGACFIKPGRIAGAAAAVVATSSILIALLTGSWTPGTRSLDAVLSRSHMQLPAYATQALEHAGLSGAAKYLQHANPESRSIGLDPSHQLNAPPGWFLPSRYEPAEILSWARPEVLSSPSNFKTYVGTARINYVIIPSTARIAEGSRSAKEHLGILVLAAANEGWAKLAYQDDNTEIWQLSPEQGQLISLGETASASITIPNEDQCAPSSSYRVRLSWTGVPTEHPVDVRVRAPNQKQSDLWATISNTGSEITGQWMSDGASMELTRDGVTIQTVTVKRQCID